MSSAIAAAQPNVRTKLTSRLWPIARVTGPGKSAPASATPETTMTMIVGGVRAHPSRSDKMTVEAKTAIIEHLGRQHQAMVTLLADLVNIDSGSYNKRGVDAVGDRLRARLEAAVISCEIFPNEIFGDCMAARIPGAGGGNRPIVLMGHRD